MLTDFVNHAKTSHMAKSAVTREISKAREEATQDIYALAQHLRVRTGKVGRRCNAGEIVFSS